MHKDPTVNQYVSPPRTNDPSNAQFKKSKNTAHIVAISNISNNLVVLFERFLLIARLHIKTIRIIMHRISMQTVHIAPSALELGSYI